MTSRDDSRDVLLELSYRHLPGGRHIVYRAGPATPDHLPGRVVLAGSPTSEGFDRLIVYRILREATTDALQT